jgi:hypothetical protein
MLWGRKPLLINRFSTSAIFCSYQSFLFFYLSHFLHYVSINALETLLVMWRKPRSILLQINWLSTSTIFIHLSHFLMIFISVSFYNVSPSIFWKQCWRLYDSIQSPGDNFAIVINDVIHVCRGFMTRFDSRGAHGCEEQCHARGTRVYTGPGLREDSSPTSCVHRCIIIR